MSKNDLNVILFAKRKKSQVLKIHGFAMDFGPHFGIILVALSHKFLYFFDIDFCIDFLMPFWREIYEKGEPEFPVQAPLFRDLFRRSIFWCILVAHWLTFGSLLAPFGSLWATLWHPLAHFWLHFGSLGLTFGDPGARFSHFWGFPASLFIFFVFSMKSYVFSFWKFALQIRLLVNQIA